jgi:hypothetical protein
MHYPSEDGGDPVEDEDAGPLAHPSAPRHSVTPRHWTPAMEDMHHLPEMEAIQIDDEAAGGPLAQSSSQHHATSTSTPSPKVPSHAHTARGSVI